MRCETNTVALAKAARETIIKAIYASKSSHIGSCYSCVDILAVIYGALLKVDDIIKNTIDRDYFVLSKGHAAAALYSILKEVGFDINLEDYGANGSDLMTHASCKVPGVELSSGSLGLGLGHCLGRALANRKDGIDSKVICLLSDGELNEGSNWESFMMASHLKLSNLTIVIDKNNLQSLTTTENTLNLGSLANKFGQFDLEVIDIDGHDHQTLRLAFQKKSALTKVIIANTIKGKGVSFMEDKVEWHYRPPNQGEYREALREIRNA